MAVYYPQEPVDPKHFAGRKKILSEISEILKNSVHGRAENAAIYGARGIGKTSLLFKVRENAPEGCYTVYYAASKEMNAKEFVDDLLQKMELQYKTGLSRYRAFLEKAKSLPSRIEDFSLFDVAISLRKDEKTPPIAFMEGILKFKERGFKSIVVFIDEADLLTDEILAMIRNGVQELRGPTYHFPISIIVAGKEDLVRRLTGKLSPIGRFFSTHRFELDSLKHEEVREALILPSKEVGIEWDEAAIDFVFTRSKGFPFIVQLYGKFALELSKNKIIDLEDTHKAHAYVISEVGAWYEHGWKEKPSPAELEVLLIIGKCEGKSSYSEVRNIAGKEVGSFLRRLVRKGCLLQDKERNEYYFPHPLVGEYVTIKYRKK